MIIRPATPDDITAMAAAAAAAYRAGFVGILDPLTLAGFDRHFFANRFERTLAGDPVQGADGSAPVMTVADTEGEVLGFAKTTGSHLDMLFVAPRVFRSGAGSALLAEAEGRGVHTLECFRDNAAARSFYERRGWVLQRAYERDFAGGVHSFVFYAKD